VLIAFAAQLVRCHDSCSHDVSDRLRSGVPSTIASSLSSTEAMATEYQTLKVLAANGDTGARGLVTELDTLGSIVPAAYPCNLLGVRNPGGPLETIWAAGRQPTWATASSV
jgi:hypothetical protein